MLASTISASLLQQGHRGEFPLVQSCRNENAMDCMFDLHISQYGPSHRLIASLMGIWQTLGLAWQTEL